jgi:HEAT repeat protein
MRRVVFAAILMLGLATAVPAASPRYDERQVAELVEIAETEKAPEARRAKAIRELENTDVRTHLGVLRRLMHQERSLDIRLSAAVTLAALGDRKAPRDLLLASAYVGDRTPNCTRSDVLLALGRVGDPAAELHLERALKAGAPEDEPYFYADACRALAILNTPGARRLLIGSLREGAVPLRQAAVTPLGTLAKSRRSPDFALMRDALIQAARTETAEEVAEQAASALFWMGVDGTAFYQLLERDPEPAVRARSARVMNRHYLSPERVQRLKSALALETDPGVRAAMQATLANQPRR